MTQRFRTGGVSQPGPERARLRLLALPLAAFMCGGASAQQTAQQYPSRPIRLIVPFAPGGGFDAVARPFAEKLAVVLGQPVVIDNRPGAGGNIGAEQAARAVPDASVLAPDAAFDRQWALTVVARALEALRGECSDAGRADFFERVKPWLTGDAAHGDQSALAAGCGLNANALKVAIHRLKRRFRELLKAEVAGTLEDPAHVEAEMGALFAALRG